MFDAGPGTDTYAVTPPPLARDESRAVDSARSPLTLLPHQPLFHEGDAADFVYQVEDGVLCTNRILPDGRRQVVAFVYPGELIGLGDAETHRASCEAVGPARVLRIPRRALFDDAARRAELGHRLFTIATAELGALQEHQILLGRRSAIERLAAFLLSLLSRTGTESAGRTDIRLPMTRADIADFLGLTIETVSRSLTKLRAMGVIDLPQSKTVVIRNMQRLRQLSEGAGALV